MCGGYRRVRENIENNQSYEDSFIENSWMLGIIFHARDSFLSTKEPPPSRGCGCIVTLSLLSSRSSDISSRIRGSLLIKSWLIQFHIIVLYISGTLRRLVYIPNPLNGFLPRRCSSHKVRGQVTSWQFSGVRILPLLIYKIECFYLNYRFPFHHSIPQGCFRYSFPWLMQ